MTCLDCSPIHKAPKWMMPEESPWIQWDCQAQGHFLTLRTKAWLHLITDLVNSHKTKKTMAFILHTYFLTLSLMTTKETPWARANLWRNSTLSKGKSITYTPAFESCLWHNPCDLDIFYNVIFTKCLISTTRVNISSNSLGYSEWHHWCSPQMSSWCMKDI